MPSPAHSAIHYRLRQDQYHAKWWCTEGRGSRRVPLKFLPLPFSHPFSNFSTTFLSVSLLLLTLRSPVSLPAPSLLRNSDEILITTLRPLSADDFCPPPLRYRARHRRVLFSPPHQPHIPIYTDVTVYRPYIAIS